MTRGRILLFLFLIALLARLVLPVIGFLPFAPDTGHYLAPARSLASFDGYLDSDGSPTAFRPPAYPIFLAGIFVVLGESLTTVQVIQGILAALLAPALFSWGERRWGRRAGLAAGIIYALDPVAIAVPAFILTEALGTVLLFSLAVLLERCRTENRETPLIAAGLIAGPLSFTTMITLLLYPVSAVLLLLSRLNDKRRWIAVAAGLLLFASPILIWSVRNREVLGENTAVRSGGFGFLLWATTRYDFPWLPSPFEKIPGKLFSEESRLTREHGVMEANTILQEKALCDMERRPAIFLVHSTRAIFWAFIEVPGAMRSLDRFGPLKWGVRGFHWLVILFAAAGIARSLDEKAALIVPLGILVYFAVFLAPLMPIPRYFAPALPFLHLLAGAAFRGGEREV